MSTTSTKLAEGIGSPQGVTLVVYSDYKYSLQSLKETLEENIQVIFAENREHFFSLLRSSQPGTMIAVIDVYDKNEVANEVLDTNVPIIAIQDEEDKKFKGEGKNKNIHYVYCFSIVRKFRGAITSILTTKTEVPSPA